MTEQQPTPADAIFFREWNDRAPGQVRGLGRAAALMAALQIGRVDASALDASPADASALVVVGSKGKGTTAIYASAYLVAAGLRTVTITSPAFLSNTERIRYDGTAIADETLAALGARLERAIATLPDPDTMDGYLSPSGLFMIAGLLHASDVHAEAVVIEAGRGGSSDEVSLITPEVVAITPIFAEHVGELGGSLAAIVANKCGVVRPQTAAVMSAQQSADVAPLLRQAVADRGSRRLTVETADTAPLLSVLPAGLGRANAFLGCAAAHRLVLIRHGHRPTAAVLERVLCSVNLPGRLSSHRIRRTPTRVIIDAAINRAGYAAAIASASARLGAIDHVLLSLPDDKDHDGAIALLAPFPVTFVILGTRHLRYTRPIPEAWTSVPSDDVDAAFIAGLGQRVLALGTISFVAHLLHVVGASNAVAFEAPIQSAAKVLGRAMRSAGQPAQRSPSRSPTLPQPAES